MIDPEIFETLVFCHGLNGRLGLPVLFKGPPGGGKTTTMKELCHAYGLHCISLILRLFPQSEIAGQPVLTENGVVLSPPRWAKLAKQLEHVVVFLDEFNTCEIDTFNAALRVVNEGVVGDMELPSTVRFLGACNPIEQATGGNDLPMALANRIGHMSALKLTAKQVRQHFMSLANEKAHSDVDVAVSIQRMAKVTAEWPTALAWAAAVVGQFLVRNEEILHLVPTPDSPQASEGWPSPRTWECVMRVLASARIHKLSIEKEMQIVQGFVGEAATVEFASFRADMDLPDATLLLDGQAVWQHDPLRPDRTYVVLAACTAAVLETDAKSESGKRRTVAVWKLLRSLVDDAGDLVLDTVHHMNQNHRYDEKYCTEVITKCMPMLKAAGMA